MHGVVKGHGAGVELAALEARAGAENERYVWRDGEKHKLPPTGVLGHDDGDREPGGDQPQDHIGRLLQALMKSSRGSYISH
jgi:hypothetical protein